MVPNPKIQITIASSHLFLLELFVRGRVSVGRSDKHSDLGQTRSSHFRIFHSPSQHKTSQKPNELIKRQIKDLLTTIK